MTEADLQQQSSRTALSPHAELSLYVGDTHRWAKPALRTADEIALMAVSMALMSWVSSPVAPLAWRPVSMTNRVRVHTSVSNADWSDMPDPGSSVLPAGQQATTEPPHYEPRPLRAQNCEAELIYL